VQKIPITNSPNAEYLWKGIGGHFDSFDQILCEFIDNAISNFVANKSLAKSIIVSIKEQLDKSVLVSIEDSGSGIENLNTAFSLGDTSGAQTPLNEHGFGMKHALASANPSNKDWVVCTRTKSDVERHEYKRIQAAYQTEGYTADLISVADENWPGELNGPGTVISFHVSRELWSSLRKGISGPAALKFTTMVDILAEDLGFIYAGLIRDNKATITIQAVDSAGEVIQATASAVNPDWKQFFSPFQDEDTCDLGGGNLKIKYSFGAMNEAKYRKYYKKNMSSSGLEIRLNGRVLAHNLFKEVWNREPHNMYNHVLVQVDVVSDKRAALPSTRTSKNGLREGDPRLEKLIEWVRLKMPEPPRDVGRSQDEKDLFEILRALKEKHIPDPKKVITEYNVYTSIATKIPVDMYVHHKDVVTIYEGKKDRTSVQDVYQLKMYWDGCILDGIQPTEGILIAAQHPESVVTLLGHVNKMNDLNGKNYVFKTETWKENQVPYPP